jgi:predicted lysophospholipase L1 biosynthesis ABC-type transport system permease subunit
MARELWQDDAVGRTFRDERQNLLLQIVGVVGDVRHRSLGEEPRPMIYFAAGQQSGRRMTLHVRSAVPAAALGPTLERLLHGLHPAAAIRPARTMAEHMEMVAMPQRVGTLTAAAIGGVELTLAVMALYGVIAFATAQRTREIGLRIALGASSTSVARLIMRDGLALAGVGVGLGIVVAIAAAPGVGDLLVGIGPADPVSVGVSPALLLLVAAIASYVPARRAVRVEPSVALRSE